MFSKFATFPQRHCVDGALYHTDIQGIPILFVKIHIHVDLLGHLLRQKCFGDLSLLIIFPICQVPLFHTRLPFTQNPDDMMMCKVC